MSDCTPGLASVGSEAMLTVGTRVKVTQKYLDRQTRQHEDGVKPNEEGVIVALLLPSDRIDPRDGPDESDPMYEVEFDSDGEWEVFFIDEVEEIK